ncbi:OmpA family protein [Burkholderia ubonensis]|uniref:OmpA family protein n=1 Tax=Burkholderia ubonensis TaxID=101571 RepID=UPI0008FDA7C5|nr:OmpA family protein [Burkholderia ubonensis]
MFKSNQSVLLLLSAAVILAGCTSGSGLKYKAYSVNQSNNSQQAYLVKCYGLFEGAGTCQERAKEICKDQAVFPLESIVPLAAESKGRPNIRELTFQCGAPKPQPPTPVATTLAPEPAVVPLPAPVNIPQKLSLGADANFDVGQSLLKPEATQRLDQLITDAHGVAFGLVKISGYTDSTGSNSANLRLSTDRAQAVVGYLRNHGLKARQYVARGYGKADPIGSNRTQEGRSLNRRVVIELER